MLASESANHLDAGRLLLEKARRVDLAIEQFQTGWQRAAGEELDRSVASSWRGCMPTAATSTDSGGCSTRPTPCLTPRAIRSTVISTTKSCEMAEEPALEAIAQEVRDRALQATARSLRRGLENRRTAGSMVSKWLGRSKLWPAALVSDAEFAVAAAAQPPRRHQFARPRCTRRSIAFQVGRGGSHGRVPGVRFRRDLPGIRAGAGLRRSSPSANRWSSCPRPTARWSRFRSIRRGSRSPPLYEHQGGLDASAFSRAPGRVVSLDAAEIPIDGAEQSWLTPILPKGVERLVGVSEGARLIVFDVASGLPRQSLRICDDLEGEFPTAGYLLDLGPGNARPASP